MSLVNPDGPAWETRKLILQSVRGLLGSEAQDGLSQEVRIALWGILAEAHRSVLQTKGRYQEGYGELVREALLDDLRWVLEVLKSRDWEVDDLAASRELWDWHRRFEKDPELLAISRELEAIYQQDPLVTVFGPLDWREDADSTRSHIEELASKLSVAGSSQDIKAFVDNAMRFFGRESAVSRISGVAELLGKYASSSEVVSEFVRQSFREWEDGEQGVFASLVVASWIDSLRQTEAEVEPHAMMRALMETCGNEEQKTILVWRVYSRFPPWGKASELTEAEHDLIRSLGNRFLSNQQGVYFIAAVGWSINYEWEELRGILEQTLDSPDLPPQHIGKAIDTLVRGIYGALHDREDTQPPRGMGLWLLEQCLRVPDLDRVGGLFSHHLEQILERVGKPSVTWLPGALHKRVQLEKELGAQSCSALSHELRLSRLVEPVSPDDLEDPDKKKAVEKLVDLVSDRGSVGYFMPEVLYDVDPDGIMVPAEVARQFQRSTDERCRWRLARIGGAYALGSLPWKAIAKPVISHAVLSSEEDQRSLFGCLTSNRTEVWSGTPGADRVSGFVGKVLCTTATSKNPTQPVHLLTHFIGKERNKQTAGFLWQPVRRSFGWPIGISYSIRNTLMHEGPRIDGNELFEGPSPASAFRLSSEGWRGIESATRERYEVEPSLLRSPGIWPSKPEDDLREVLDVCEREMDDALGSLLGAACHTLQAHAAFMLGED